MEQVSIQLTSDISYVYGIVNDVEATFTLTGTNVWSATVEKSSNGKYEIAITAYNAAGTSTSYNTVIYKLDEPITPKLDWTKDDYYNADDLNRVEANTQFIKQYLESIYYIVPAESFVVDRTLSYLDFLSSINRIEENINIIKNSFLTPPGWQNKKTWTLGKGFSYLDANRLENNLDILYKWAVIAKKNLIYSGTFSCGTDWEGGLY